MKKQSDWKVLRYVAEHSPREHAALILRRNEWALETLDKLYNGVDEEVDTSADYGCPPCMEVCGVCMRCLWHTAIKETSTTYLGCADVTFRGQTLQDVSAVVAYARHSVILGFPESEQDYLDARDFLLGHIEWAKRGYWGKKYKT